MNEYAKFYPSKRIRTDRQGNSVSRTGDKNAVSQKQLDETQKKIPTYSAKPVRSSQTPKVQKQVNEHQFFQEPPDDLPFDIVGEFLSSVPGSQINRSTPEIKGELFTKPLAGLQLLKVNDDSEAKSSSQETASTSKAESVFNFSVSAKPYSQPIRKTSANEE